MFQNWYIFLDVYLEVKKVLGILKDIPVVRPYLRFSVLHKLFHNLQNDLKWLLLMSYSLVYHIYDNY